MKWRQWLVNNRTKAGSKSKQLIQLSDDVSKMLQKIVITLLVAVVFCQLAMQSNTVRRWVTSVDRLEGTPFQ
ncbi:hypothetical protein FHS18_001311 [Paenibacillus phyllosphaerae]|uniref:Uncharacterized protein n=1 Tax=Paenibacillus phyllosphaerae TaxID=274593 RepID=A0A7W5FLR3_9BACL|nr:hypothetical protein [Paenibacillus phyllosphaerae]MBB3109259.1 hypothetical protein [Paenibacillus phyllosphaerae]